MLWIICFRTRETIGRRLIGTEAANKLANEEAMKRYQEGKAGIGYVDFVFYPFRKDDDAIIIELKVNHTAEEALRQIKVKQYELRFEGKMGEKPEYTGRVIAVGIAYQKEDPERKHECKVEVLRERS